MHAIGTYVNVNIHFLSLLIPVQATLPLAAAAGAWLALDMSAAAQLDHLSHYGTSEGRNARSAYHLATTVDAEVGQQIVY